MVSDTARFDERDKQLVQQAQRIGRLQGVVDSARRSVGNLTELLDGYRLAVRQAIVDMSDCTLCANSSGAQMLDTALRQDVETRG